MKIAICFHLGYINRFYEFTPYIDQVLTYCPNTDILITYREAQDPTIMCKRKYPNAVVIKADRGADTGAFLVQIKRLLATNQEYDYIFKIHTKSNDKWKEELLNGLAGDQVQISRVFQIFRDYTNVGIIGAKRWIIKRTPSDVNEPVVNEICRRYQVQLDRSVSFVGGTIFWMRMSVAKKIAQQFDIVHEYAICELGKKNEPSKAHAWERLFGYMTVIYAI
jgi:lipopolysaccharide biosynthesis protein